MSVRVHDSVRQPFVLTAEDVLRVWTLLEQQVGPTCARSTCADGVERTFPDSHALTTYDNLPAREIRSLHLSASSPTDRDCHVSISFGEDFSRSIGLRLEGPEVEMAHLRTVIRDLCEGIRPWYSWITRIDGFYLVWGVASFGYLVLSVMTGDTRAARPHTFSEAVSIVAVILAVLGVLMGAVWGFNYLRNRYFPVAMFAIGQGAQRHQRHESMRWVVVVGFLVSVAASLLVALVR